ncbi:M28 family peptidase [Candidatus Uabimicrobium sp. HlEnr_7]|uniref:M28 family peptidase n=1 Tax=Candidatus Uabimicrobium helgolandensis TaxID=3095367 RepID=UPI0035579F53
MQIYHSSQFRVKNFRQNVATLTKETSVSHLQNTLKNIVGARHYSFNPQHNNFVKEWIATQLTDYGYSVYLQGKYGNIVALPQNVDSAVIVIAAHYDSIAESPGADDNGSAVAALVECARVLAQCSIPVCFVAFNCEEDGLLGSYDFVENLNHFPYEVKYVHVLEMVGFCSYEENSQEIPAGIPIENVRIGDFIALVGDQHSGEQLTNTLQSIATYSPNLPALGLLVDSISQSFLHILKRSDHFPFWQAQIPALMWTDTAEYRNPHYHKKTDTIDTIDFDFLQKVTESVVACVLEQSLSDS